MCVCVCVCVYSSPCWLCQLFPLFTSALLKTQSQTAMRPPNPPHPFPPPPSPPPHAPSGQHRRHMGGSSPNLTYVDPQLIARPNSPLLKLIKLFHIIFSFYSAVLRSRLLGRFLLRDYPFFGGSLFTLIFFLNEDLTFLFNTL